MMATTYEILGDRPPKYVSPCAVCGERASNARDLVLLRAPDKSFAVAHASCAGGRWRSKVGGDRYFAGPSTLSV